jgi:hypothetical protein
LYGNLDDAKVLFMRERGAFTRGAARHEKINAGVDLAAYKSAEHTLIERSIRPKWSY